MGIYPSFERGWGLVDLGVKAEALIEEVKLSQAISYS